MSENRSAAEERSDQTSNMTPASAAVTEADAASDRAEAGRGMMGATSARE